MPEVTHISSRKSDHIRINLEENVQSALTTGLERYRFIHRALPELNLRISAWSRNCLGVRRAPILISSMTGGQPKQASSTARWRRGPTNRGRDGLGSQRAAIEHPELASTFQVRSVAPDILLFANLGAIQLNYGYGIDECRRAVEMIEADALILHFNALQEAVQPEGDTRFAGLLKQIEAVCKALPVPVIAKEVGWGFSRTDAALLAQAGVAAIDVAGAGGTSWTQVEMHRAQNESQRQLAAAFINWGIPTAEAIQNVCQAAPTLPIIASGGLRSGVDIAKCLALGAVLGGMAGPFLKAAAQSLETTIQTIEEIRREIQVCMFATGSSDLAALRKDKLTHDA
jgi:isopentenyl-diphosphate delta-isomerase